MCGVAMLGSRSNKDSPDFDTFDCLRCEAVIEFAPVQAKPKGNGSDSE
jgi:hypothetical protein